jgi:hypothetical protein
MGAIVPLYSLMVLLFGNKNYGDHLGFIVTRCPNCRSDQVFAVHQERRKLTVYFVPTIQYRVKQYMTCTRCVTRYEIAEELKTDIAQRLMTKEQLHKLLGELAGGTALTAPACSVCSSSLNTGMKYCPQCGTKLILPRSP